MMASKRNRKRFFYFAIAIVGALLIIAIVFFQFTSLGYRMTVQYRDFTEVQTNVYIDNGYSGNRDEANKIINAAKDRVVSFWGIIKSSPKIIISDNKNTIARLGGDHDTVTMVLFGAHSYISVSAEYLNIDVVAHELTHAELHSRCYKGKLPQSLVPTWFDEGVALQNDYREQYSEETWMEKTNYGLSIIELDEMDTASEFYAGDIENRRFRYMISRHEVKNWIEMNGFDAFVELINKINAGENFHELYHQTR